MATKNSKLSVSKESISLDPVKVVISPKKQEERRAYFVGLTKESPVSVAYVGGQEFPKAEEYVKPMDDGTTTRYPHEGKVVHLTLDQVEVIKTKMETAIIRPRGQGFTVTTRETKHYRALDTDIPVAKYAYMMPVENEDIRAHQATEQVTMI